MEQGPPLSRNILPGMKSLDNNLSDRDWGLAGPDRSFVVALDPGRSRSVEVGPELAPRKKQEGQTETSRNDGGPETEKDRR